MTKLEKYKQEAGLTYKEIAVKCNLHFNTVEYIIKEKRKNISLENISNICKALGLKIVIQIVKD